MISKLVGFQDRQELVENTVMRDLRPSIDYIASIAILVKKSPKSYSWMQ